MTPYQRINFDRELEQVLAELPPEVHKLLEEVPLHVDDYPSPAVLAEHGWEPRTFGSASPGTWAWRHLVRTFNEIAFDGRASSVDLHWRLDPSPGALPDFAEAWARRDVVPVDDVVAVPTLSPADAFEHSCWHAAKDEWRWLRSLVDVHRLARLPAVWEAVDRPLSAPVRNTLAVTGHLLGLPAAVPPQLRPQVRTCGSLGTNSRPHTSQRRGASGRSGSSWIWYSLAAPAAEPPFSVAT